MAPPPVNTYARTCNDTTILAQNHFTTSTLTAQCKRCDPFHCLTFFEWIYVRSSKEASSANIKVAITNRWTFESNRFSTLDLSKAQEMLLVFVQRKCSLHSSKLALLLTLVDFLFEELSNELAWNFTGSSMDLALHKTPLSMCYILTQSSC